MGPRWVVILLQAMTATVPEPEPPDLSPPVWLVAPTGNAENLLRCNGVEFDRSNNNVAIAIHGERFYVAIRSAPHHHPRPPSQGGVFSST
jgi:hypothetical protein